MKRKFIKPAISDVGVVARYKLWAGLTTTGEVFDYSLGGKPGTLSGTDIAPDYPGFSFNGSDDFIDVGNQGGAIKTVAVWILSPDVQTASFPLDLNGTDFFKIEGGDLDPGGFVGRTLYIDGVAGVAVSNDTWHCAGLTIATAKTASDLDIGRVGGVGLFTGSIGEVLLFDRELVVADMKSLFELTRWRYRV